MITYNLLITFYGIDYKEIGHYGYSSNSQLQINTKAEMNDIQ